MQISNSLYRFLLDWFGMHGGRELGDPKRWFTDNPMDLVNLIQRCVSQRKPCFMSVQPFRSRNVVLGLEKLYFDFDSKTEPPDLDRVWSDVLSLVERLKNGMSIDPLIVATYRGYHVYAFLWSIVKFSSSQQAVAKDLYANLQNRLLNGRSYTTLDPHVIGDVKRLSRVPYSLHERGVTCTPLDFDRQPLQLDSLDRYRKHGIQQDLFREVMEEIKNKRIAREILEVFDSSKSKPMVKVPSRRKWQIRLCFTKALEKGEMPHEMRMALCYEAHCAGMNRDQIVDLYRRLHDFDEAYTRYQVNWLLDQKKEKEVKPYKCRTLQRKGWCLGEACPMFKH